MNPAHRVEFARWAGRVAIPTGSHLK